jgi:hypothetical protein
MRRRRRSNPLGLLFALALGLLLVGGSVWLDRRGEKVLAPVQAKNERVTIRHDPQGTWYRWYELGVGIGGSGVPTWVASVEVPEARFDSIRIGDSVEVRYLPQLPLFARASDRSTATVAREAAQRVGIVPLLLWLAAGIAGLWMAARIGTLAVVAGGLAWVAAGFPVLLSAPSPPAPAGAEGTARVHAVTLVAKSPERARGRRRRSRAEWRRLAVPYQVVHLLVPAGRSDTVLAIDAVDSGSVRGLSIGADLPIRFDPNAPRNARLVPGTRSFIRRNRYHYLPIAIGLPALGMLAALGYRWGQRRKRGPAAARPGPAASVAASS